MKRDKSEQVNILRKLVKHDIRCSRYHTFCLIVPAFVLILFTCFFLQRDVVRMTANGALSGKASYADYIFRFMQGMPVFIADGSTSQFKIPAVWLVFHWWLSYIVGAYAIEDLKFQGANVLLRMHSRRLWWFGKCIWAVATVLFYYAFTMTLIFVFAALTGNISSTLTPVLHDLPVDALEKISGCLFVVMGVLVPVLISITLTLIQLTITIWVNQLVGNIVILMLLMISAYICNPLLPGNYLMLLRSSLIIGKEGVSVETGIVIAISFSVIALIAGTLRFEKYDVK